MADRIVEITEDFWNVRGSYKLRGLIELGTQTSLVRLASGRFVLLDSYTLAPDVLERIRARTDGGRAVEAIVNVHPFHTLYVRAAHEQFPEARLYGTARHVEREPELPWEEIRTEDPAMNEQFGGEFRFSVPDGLEFIHPNPDIHASSVLAFHLPSRTLHVDDTLTWLPLPLVGGLGFHAFTKQSLSRRPGASADFRAWARQLIAWCADVDHLCTAHARPLSGIEGPEAIQAAVQKALDKLEPTLAAHEKKWG